MSHVFLKLYILSVLANTIAVHCLGAGNKVKKQKSLVFIRQNIFSTRWELIILMKLGIGQDGCLDGEGKFFGIQLTRKKNS